MHGWMDIDRQNFCARIDDATPNYMAAGRIINGDGTVASQQELACGLPLLESAAWQERMSMDGSPFMRSNYYGCVADALLPCTLLLAESKGHRHSLVPSLSTSPKASISCIWLLLPPLAHPSACLVHKWVHTHSRSMLLVETRRLNALLGMLCIYL